MTEQIDARRWNVQRVGEVPVGGRRIGINTTFAWDSVARSVPAIIVCEQVHTKVAEPRVELRAPAVADVAEVSVRDEHPRRLRTSVRGGYDPRIERYGVRRWERDGLLLEREAALWRIDGAGPGL